MFVYSNTKHKTYVDICYIYILYLQSDYHPGNG